MLLLPFEYHSQGKIILSFNHFSSANGIAHMPDIFQLQGIGKNERSETQLYMLASARLYCNRNYKLMARPHNCRARRFSNTLPISISISICRIPFSGASFVLAAKRPPGASRSLVLKVVTKCGNVACKWRMRVCELNYCNWNSATLHTLQFGNAANKECMYLTVGNLKILFQFILNRVHNWICSKKVLRNTKCALLYAYYSWSASGSYVGEALNLHALALVQ